MAKKQKVSFAKALAAVRKEGRGVAGGQARIRWSEARGAYYVPIRSRSAKGKMGASKYDLTSCSAGANAAMARGYAASPRMSCGPKGMGDKRSHALLGYWKGIVMGTPGSLTRFTKNPSELAYVWVPNPGAKSQIQWGLIDPHTESVLLSGTASNPDAGYKAAHKKSREMISSGEWTERYAPSDVEMRASGEWTQVPRGGKKKKAKKKAKKKVAKKKTPKRKRKLRIP